VAFLGDKAGYFFAVDLSNGVIAWVTLLGGPTSPAVLDRNSHTVYTVCNSGQLYALSMRNGSILWKVSGLFNPAQFEVFGSLLLNSENGNILVGVTNTAYTSTNHIEKIVAVSIVSHKVLSQVSLSNSNHSQSGLSQREMSLGLGSYANTLFVIGQKAVGTYTGLTSLCYSPYAYRASDLSSVAYSQPFCQLNTNAYTFDYDGQVPLFFNSEGPAQQHSMCNMSLIAVKIQNRLVVLNAKNMVKVQSYPPVKDLEQVNSPAAWDPESGVLVVTMIVSTFPFSGSLVGLKLGSDCQLRELWKTEVGPFSRNTHYIIKILIISYDIFNF
jgi:outer membrane protein assembly factor BamB